MWSSPGTYRWSSDAVPRGLGHWQAVAGAAEACGAAARVKVVGCDAADGRVIVNCEAGVEVACVQGAGRLVDILRRERLPLAVTVVEPEARRGMTARADAWVERASASVDADGNVHAQLLVVVKPTLVAAERVSIITHIVSDTSELVDVETAWVTGERVVAEGSMQVDVADSVPYRPSREPQGWRAWRDTI